MARIFLFRPLLTLVVVFGFLVPLACAGSTPTPQPFPGGPNLTLTALFKSLVTPEPGEETPAAPVASPPAEATQAPTAPAAPTDAPTQAPTAEATAVPSPAPTLTSAPARSGPIARAVFLSIPPTIDGSLSDLGGEIYLINTVVYGKDSHMSNVDASGRFLVSWDSQYLYVGVEVMDDVFVQNATGNQIYKGDCIELLFDAFLGADFQSSELSDDDYQLGLTPGRGQIGVNKENWLWYPRGKSGALQNVTWAAQSTSSGYVLEAAVPWSVFEVSPSAGQRFGFSVSISDNDDTANDVQQTMVSFAPNRRLTDPTSWATLELVLP
jgi:hypothetical protein